MTTLGSFKAGPVTGSVTVNPTKYYSPSKPVGLSANLNVGGGVQANLQSSGPIVQTETLASSNKNPTVSETITVGVRKPTTTITPTIGQSRSQTIVVSGGGSAGIDNDGGVKSVTAKILEQYDRKNTGLLENAQLGALLQDIYKILGESYFPKPEDIEGLARVLDINKDGRVTSDDIEAVCQKYLGGAKKVSGPVVRKGGEREVRSSLREEEDAKPKPPEVEFATQIFDATKIFEKFDMDKSGFLEEIEIPFVLQETYNKIGIKKEIDPKQVKSYIEALDQNKDGKISLDEFIKVLVDNLIKDKEKYKPTGVSYSAGGYQRAVIKTDLEKAREIFDRHDTDKSGFLEPHEIPDVLRDMLSSVNIRREITTDDVKAYLRSFDKNLDQKISFEEFARLVDVAKKN